MMMMIDVVIKDAVKFGKWLYVEISKTSETSLQTFMDRCSDGVFTDERGVKYKPNRFYLLQSQRADNIPITVAYGIIFCSEDVSNKTEDEIEKEIYPIIQYMKKV